jgi:hypothetical protein
VSEIQDITASGVVQAVTALAKISATGQWFEVGDRVSLHEIFSRMTRRELEAYAAVGELPGWCSELIQQQQGYSQPIASGDDEKSRQ